MVQAASHQGTKASKVAYVGGAGLLVTTGFSRHSDRQLAVWAEADLAAPLKIENIDSSSGVLTPVVDPDTGMVYVFGRGDGNVRYYEVSAAPPHLAFLSQVISGEPQKGFAVMPKRACAAAACEVFRLYKVHATRDLVEPISMIVPRKSATFQADLFPDTAAPVAALTAAEWVAGAEAAPLLMSMRPGSGAESAASVTASSSLARTSRGRDKSPRTEAVTGALPLVRDTGDDSLVISDKNNDKKFHFLSRETQPDYRQKLDGGDKRADSIQVRSSSTIEHGNIPWRSEQISIWS